MQTITVTLNEKEREIITSLLDKVIKGRKRGKSDPFYMADIVNMYRRLTEINKTVPLVTPKIEVIQNTPINEEHAPVLPPVTVQKSQKVTPENIDTFSDAMVEDATDEEPKIEEPQVKTAS